MRRYNSVYQLYQEEAAIREHQNRLRSNYSYDLSNWQPPVSVAPEISSPLVHSRASPTGEIEGQYFDPTSGLNFLHRAWKKLLTTQNDQPASYRLSVSEQNQLLTSAGDRPFHIESDALDSFIPDASTARKLQQFYFETCVVTYRMFHRPSVEGWMEIFLKDGQGAGPTAWSLGKAKTATLLTIMAIANLRLHRVSGETSTEAESLALKRSDHLFCAGMRMTEEEIGFPRLESAQARLVQVLYLLQTSRINKAWYTFGNAFQITLSLGMHRRRDQKRDYPFTSRRQDYITSECYKRTFWVAYTVDRYLSVVLGRPRLYQDEDIDQNFPDTVNDEDMTPDGFSISDDPADCYIDALIYHAKIAQIIGKISREVYSVSELYSQNRLAAAHRLGRELHEWRESLPPHLAGFLPGAVLVISKWYLPNETQTRIAILYTSAASGGAFSGLLAFAIAKMDGTAGYEGWRWIFIIEGLVTVGMSVACYLLLLDSPSLSPGWLTPDEIRFLEVRQLASSSHSAHDGAFSKRVIFSVLTDWKIYLLILANWSNAVPNYALKFSMPEIVKSMGYKSAKAQLLTIPPYAIGAASAYGFSVFADRSSWRMPFIVVPQMSLIVAFSILFSKAADIENNIALCYFGICLACFGMYPILPGVNSWNICNIPNPQKRAVAIGYLICTGNAGGIIGSYIYKADEKPRYPTGYGTSFAFVAAGIMACLVLEFSLWTANKKKGRMSRAEVEEIYNEDQLREMGEKSPHFNYTL
ncbi:hypothetical protein KXV79_004985 [Aspergillus fumigatus]|nr:hypothetical protein KXX48_006482 [Aspergillus fumigatus]KAH1301251.1 hypothetical protein KXX66_005750 [Aspergillus fumigatus]KAH1662939.1 hypothetical protein KXX46_006131 [Aspergillus fumigatus]KAH2643632.1 hypothetical protein KXV79_004985 [Aspergillus fumigatus]KAH2848956.1 hypothetical protein KXW36_006630 [Aspergillus fumigatus]